MNSGLWAVYRGKIFTGIVESNYEYAKAYWEERSRVKGVKFTLVEYNPPS